MKTHSPTPLELEKHHIWPLGMGGPDTPDNWAWVCPTTHTNIHELLRYMVKHDIHVPYSVFQNRYEQPVSRYAYNLAVEGYFRWKAKST